MKYMDMNTLRYQLLEVHGIESLFNEERFQDHDLESTNIFLDSVKDFCDKECFPYFREMDEKPAKYEDGGIKIHAQIPKIFEQAGELGLLAGTFDYDNGGLQLPNMIEQAAFHIIDAANNHVGGYLGLTSGAASLIANYGTQALKDIYLEKMLSGVWTGTMCLTEPQSGSSLSSITTTAIPQADGSYKIKGQKIFISGGDNQYSENIIHLLLARIEGAPAGTKGISLFVVPKKRLESDGRLVSNDVIAAGDFQKMGQRGYCTAHLVFGENEDCKAWLVGHENRGLRHMFLMMNGARIAVGRHGASVASAAYQASLKYAKERPQGRRLPNGKNRPHEDGQTLIINHPDVRRMLLLQKAVAEGSLSLVLETAKYLDLSIAAATEEERARNLNLLEILTPIVKTYPSEMGRVSVNNGLQILGGYGFCSDFVLQQYYRDIRIMAIYEGTTGIQSIDLLGRKVSLGQGKALKLLAAEMQETIMAATTFDDLKFYAKVLSEKMLLNQKILGTLLPYAKAGNHERFLADASIYMEFFSTIILGWQWLKMAVTAKQALVTGKQTYEAGFYESKIQTMRFFYKYEMSKTNSWAEIMMNEEVLTLVEEEEMVF